MGTTDEPGIARLQELKRLGEGKLPEPARPTWDQLLNGSQDSQWAEIGGLVESLTNRANGWSRVLLRTRSGVLKVDLRQAGVRPGPLEQYENAVVRLRGCLFADRTADLRLKVGQVRMSDVEINVDQPAPADPFSLPQTTVVALKRFDPAFDASRRVKVAGQIVGVRGADYFVMDGKDGFRFLARQALGLEVGDVVEAVGFPELSGAAPVLRAAVARKTGHGELPAPKKLSADDLTLFGLDSTLVQVEGLLTGIRQTKTNLVLEMQSGSWRYLARLNTQAPFSVRMGSRLELTGVYCAQGGYSALGADVAPVDLLLSRPADIRVLAEPSWWTLPRLLVAVGVLAFALVGSVLWISQLRRQVEERTAELTVQIQSRQQLEQKRALDHERARIAQDLHDELGSDLVTVGMLAARAKFATAPEEKRSEYLDQVRGKAHEMVAALDEIVWAMNPGHDSLTSLVSYLGNYADRFLGLANINVRLDNPPPATDRQVDSRVRHEVFLAFKEALTNVVHHSGATEVHLSFQAEAAELRLAVADNGRGLGAERTGEMNGLANMRHRVEKLGGQFEITGQNSHGTSVHFSVPLNGVEHI
jgi:signal transduction histidine kinase